ncbi:MAG: YbaN family protein [Oscillospiraceae bacterium]|jgi:uncharacterized membrane protein YbaN (DUF454 family)|nr:YbaN family protein [Oscillospiraceae bacterium]
MKRVLLNVLGFLALGLGAVGLALPIMPTTPFVLCAAGCFSAANPAAYRRLARSRFFGEYVTNYREKTGIGTASRVRGLVFLWSMLLLSAALARRPLVWAILGTVGVAVSIHILTIRRKRG